MMDLSDDSPIDLTDEFGALKLETCDAKSCVETVTYTVAVENIGGTEMDVTLLHFTFKGDVESLLSMIPAGKDPLQVGGSFQIKVEKGIDVCSEMDFAVLVRVEANPPGGSSCEDH